MKTVTTIREYDEEGRLVKETVSEVILADGPVVTYHCTCGTSAICPVHAGYTRWWQAPWICSGGVGVMTSGDTRVTYN